MVFLPDFNYEGIAAPFQNRTDVANSSGAACAKVRGFQCPVKLPGAYTKKNNHWVPMREFHLVMSTCLLGHSLESPLCKINTMKGHGIFWRASGKGFGRCSLLLVASLLEKNTLSLSEAHKVRMWATTPVFGPDFAKGGFCVARCWLHELGDSSGKYAWGYGNHDIE